MTEREALFESALESLPDGFAVLDANDEVIFWNQGAEAITGFAAQELTGNVLPSGLQRLCLTDPRALDSQELARATRVNLVHKLGHEVSMISRSLTLRNESGEAIGQAILFHPADQLDALPRAGGNESQAVSQAEFEERLRAEFEDFERGGEPLGVLWVCVDQAQELRKTHGIAALNSMIEKVQHAVVSGLRPSEELCRWGDEEFLIAAHERTSEMLTRHAARLAGVARTADFRWWGDRLSVTVSIGATQAQRFDTLNELLKRARKAMETSLLTGGNRITFAAKEINEHQSPEGN